MSNIDNKSSDSFENEQPGKPSVSSINKQCLESLRFPTNDKGASSRPKTHLLAYMAEFIPEESSVKVEEAEDFCCFDRMKKLIEKRKGDNEKTKDEQNLEGEKLLKFIQIEAKMKKMQYNLMRYSKTPKHQPGDSKKPKSATSNLFLTSPVDQGFKDAVLTQPNENLKQRNQNLPGRYSMKKNIRDQGYKQYLEWQKKKMMDTENAVKEFVETEIEEKVKTMLEERDLKFNELLKHNKNLERSILEKNLEIQNLKAKQQMLMKNLEALEAFKDNFSEENTSQSKQRQIMLENFYQNFSEQFPDETVKSLREYITAITDKCLKSFMDVQCKKSDKWNQQKRQMVEKISKLQTNIQKSKSKEFQLLQSLKQSQNTQNIAAIEMDGLWRNKSELEKIQRKILELYNDWYGNLSESEKGLMKNLGYLQQSYEYEEMLQYIMVFKKKFSTDSKVNEYLIKILRGIQRIRKILFPRTVSNSGDRQLVMDPLFILEKLQKYIKCKVYQIQKKGGSSQKGLRSSQIVEKEFLEVDGDFEQGTSTDLHEGSNGDLGQNDGGANKGQYRLKSAHVGLQRKESAKQSVHK